MQQLTKRFMFVRQRAKPYVLALLYFCGSASTVLTGNGDRPSQWEMANFDPSQNRNPWADCNQIPHNWLRPPENPLNQIWYKTTNPSVEGFWPYGWNITFLCLIYLYLFFCETRVQTGWLIFTRDSSGGAKGGPAVARAPAVKPCAPAVELQWRWPTWP